jgi:dienelactone hydrolase
MLHEEPVFIPAGEIQLEGALDVPDGATGLVIFAQGSGSSRKSSRNRFVAERVQEAGFGTLLLDLLTEAEDRVYPNRFDIPMLVSRLVAATAWAETAPRLCGLSIGYFGASTGAAAALTAAAELGDRVSAVVSREGRPDLAKALERVKAPTLLIVGGLDEVVLELNREACGRLRGRRKLATIPGATHLFDEPGALEQAARLARRWFDRHLAPRPTLRPECRPAYALEPSPEVELEGGELLQPA